MKSFISIVIFSLLSFSLNSEINALGDESLMTSIIYVDAKANSGGDGKRWSSSYRYLQDALYEANSIATSSNLVEIWVAEGTYYPDLDEAGLVTNNDRSVSFQLNDYLTIYGGFINGDTFNKRNWHSNKTVLSGDINQSGDLVNNSYHVVYDNNSNANLNGLNITMGNADGMGSEANGGGIYLFKSTGLIRNCTFYENYGFYGGAIFNTGNSNQIDNSIFYRNTAKFNGKSIYNSANDTEITNCTFTDNLQANIDNIYLSSSADVEFRNSIMWSNTIEVTVQTGGVVNISYSIVQGGYTGSNNLNLDPLFEDVSNFDLALSPKSPAIEAGDNTVNTATIDAYLNERIHDVKIDIGAVEYQGQENALYVNKNATGNNTGVSWYNAYNDLQDALTYARNNASTVNRLQVWVKEGIYYPDDGVGYTNNSRDASFMMISYVQIYGGFNGCEKNLAERDWQSNVTTLSGDIDQNDVTFGNSGNSYHVVENSPPLNEILYESMLDGFVITKGNSDGSGLDDNGSAIFSYFAGNPLISNCIIEQNSGIGYAIHNYSSSTIIQDCIIQSNMMGGIHDESANADILDCIIRNNQRSGIYQESSGSLIEGCLVQNNQSTGNGGGLRIEHSNPIIRNCTVEANSSNNQGGGIRILGDGFMGATTQIINTIIRNNSADYGGGVYIGNESVLTNCLITKNTDNNNSGGGRVFDHTQFINCTFFGNTGGLSVVDAAPILNNCILWSNGSEINLFQSTNPRLNNCIVQGGFTDGTVNNVTSSYPEFIDTFSQNYNLRICSPAIDAGIDSYNSEMADLSGEDRTFNSELIGSEDIDIGAYEVQVYYSSDCNDTPCEVLTETPVVRILSESMCDDGSSSGGLLGEPTSSCPNGTTIKYSLDGINYSTTLPNYDQDQVITIRSSCICDYNDSVMSPISMITTTPEICSTCDEHLILSGTISSGTYEASSSITCNGTIQSGANVTFSAPDSVVMTNNFNVIATATYEVNDTGCSPD